MARPKRTKRSSTRFAAWILLVALCTAGSQGCAGGRIFKPATMPREFMAARLENPQAVDLSKLAGPSVSSNLIDRGDLLEVSIQTGYGTDSPDTFLVRVSEDGVANLPLIGPLPLAGLQLEQAEQAIAAMGVQREFYRNPNVTVAMKQQRTNKVTIVGAVQNPGSYELPRGTSSLLTALVSAGGLTKDSGADIEVRHPARNITRPADVDKLTQGPTTSLTSFTPQQQQPSTPSGYRVNLVSAAKQTEANYYLDDGDVVMVEKRQVKPVHVMGMVLKPGQFELPADQDLHVLDVLAMAGGESSIMADKVHVIRQVPNQEAAVIEISLSEAKRKGQGNLRLAPGDVVTVEQTPATMFGEAIKNFVRFTVGSNVTFF